MKGFKSFANQTELIFGEKYNVVLGPNGSGKSNILDSLVFVLGKSGSKGLRAEKTANLIYNGGKTKQPAKEGRVSIYFDNASKVFGEGFPELKITRTVKESGQSDYEINDRKRTRQEVVEMLEKARIDPDGHNIILQGDIIHLIEMSGLERRQLIEEIAGIGVYEEKKEKALKELERVDEKLNETHIILTEREAYLRELKSERDQAMQFRQLQDSLRRNKKTVLEVRRSKRMQEREKHEAIGRKHQEEIALAQGRIEEARAQVGANRKEIDEINREIERKGEKEQVALHKEVETLRVDIGVKKARVETLSQEVVKVGERRDSLVKTNQELFERIKYIEEEKRELERDAQESQRGLAQVGERIAEFKRKHSVDDAGRLDKQIEEIDAKAERLQDELARMRAEQQEKLREKDRLDIRAEQADERMAKVLEAEKSNRKQLDALKGKQDAFKQATKELQGALSDDASIASQLSSARAKVSAATDELTRLRAESLSLKEGGAGGAAVAKVLAQKDKMKGVVGTVAELGTVRGEHQLALEIAAGGRLSSIVVEDDKTAGECIDFLRRGQHGVATFLPLNRLRAPAVDASLKELAKKDGVVGLAIDLVDYDRRFEPVFRFVLGNTVVVDTLETARRIGIGKARMVTLQGDLADTSGAMQGGFRAKGRTGMGFAGKELAERVARLERELADSENVLAKLEQKRRDTERVIEGLRSRKAELEAEVITIEKTLHIDSQDLALDKQEKQRMQDERARLEKELDDIVARVSRANRELASLKIEKQRLREQISGMRSPEVLAQLTSFEEKQASVREHISGIAAKMKANDAQLTSVLGPEAARIKEIMKQQDRELQSFRDEQEALRASLAALERSLKEKDELEKKFLSQFKGLFAQREQASERIGKLEGEIDKHQLKAREMEAKNINVSMELARVKAELAGVDEELARYLDVEAFPGKKEEDCLVEIKEFERMLAGIGAVNMKALDMYEQVEREYKDLVGKREKLALEREDVLVMINEIDAKKAEIFMRAFDALNRNFQRIFTTLSAKGEAYLEIENPKDVFSGGVAIKVKLSGKKFMDIRSLSGGEKTMTALAFLFAVQEHEPAQFYVLDEVDAALDKHNSEKLGKLVRAYCKDAQYLVISHNDAIISEADNLYGVSMNEHGISKVTTLKI